MSGIESPLANRCVFPELTVFRTFFRVNVAMSVFSLRGTVALTHEAFVFGPTRVRSKRTTRSALPRRLETERQVVQTTFARGSYEQETPVTTDSSRCVASSGNEVCR